MYLSSFQDFTTDKSTSVLVRSKNKGWGGGGNSPGSGSATDDEVLNLNICSKHDFKSTCSDPFPIEFVMRPSTHSGDDGGVVEGSFLKTCDF